MNFKFAFTFYRFGADDHVFTDETFVKWRAEEYVLDWGNPDPAKQKLGSRLLDFHVCTEEDFAELYPVSEDDQAKL